MEWYFNIAGPCFPDEHYMLPALERLPEVRGLVRRGQCFVIHAPRQTGKTTAIQALAREIMERLREPRVRRVVEPVILGSESPVSRDSEELRRREILRPACGLSGDIGTSRGLDGGVRRRQGKALG